tara:strand:+ start:1411 stop:1938 length:528 start_codon:yes stop_codon:yes gene_type:complete
MPRKKSPAYKMKGFSGFGNSPAKQEGPIPKKNLKLQKGEMEGTWIYPGSDKNERIIDYEDRVEFAESDAESSGGKEKKQHLANAKKLQHEADIIRNRKSPAKVSDDKLLQLQGELNHSELDFKEPGWAKIAGKIHGGAMNIAKGALGGMAGGGGGEGAAEGAVSAAQKAAREDLE